MSPEQVELVLHSMNEQIDKSIKMYVNGKIDRIDLKIDNYIKEDNLWKQTATPTIELGNNIRGFGKVIAYILGIGAGIFAIVRIFK